MLITSLGMDVESVSRQLGHTTSSITLSTYSHEFDSVRNVDKHQGRALGRVRAHFGDLELTFVFTSAP